MVDSVPRAEGQPFGPAVLAGQAPELRPDRDMLFLDPLEVHLWSLDLGAAANRLENFERLLSPQEAERAGRFHFEQHRRCYIASHGWIRQVLGLYLSLAPATLQFRHGPQGKPSIAGSAEPRLQFNLSHSGAFALLGVSPRARIGVDVERVRELPDAEELVARFFSPREAARFRALPADQKPEAFFNLWTRKEALLKATGEGIGHLLAQVEVTFVPSEPARLLELPTQYARASTWSIESMVPAPGYVAAVAVESTCAKPVLRPWKLPAEEGRL